MWVKIFILIRKYYSFFILESLVFFLSYLMFYIYCFIFFEGGLEFNFLFLYYLVEQEFEVLRGLS